MNKATDSLRKLLASVAPALPEQVGVELLVPIVKGTVQETIVEALKERGCSLCIVGTRGLGSFDRIMRGLLDRLFYAGLGSVSDSVLRAAPCPILLVPSVLPDDKAAPAEKPRPTPAPPLQPSRSPADLHEIAEL